MNYNDYPILDENAYEFIKEKYSKLMPFNRDELTTKLLNKLEECKSICLGLNNINFKLKKVVADCYNNLSSFSGSLQNLFNKTIKCEIKEFNIFSLLLNLVECSIITNQWYNHEEKEYYKNLANNLLQQLQSNTKTILETLLYSNVFTFKHM